ncbi:hypothetical protein [Streptomyces sp. NPDC088789]|uniref:hypothetical protein n=1 Tax=Streptomyces sp. NPDC088789 TaxID=3365899 RepID=UPI00382792C8
MTREERLALLGPEIVAHIHDLVREAPDPTPELVEALRRIVGRPPHPVPQQPTAKAA